MYTIVEADKIKYIQIISINTCFFLSAKLQVGVAVASIIYIVMSWGFFCHFIINMFASILQSLTSFRTKNITATHL